MSRDDGFAVADVSVSKLNDPKFRRLWRALRNEEPVTAEAAMNVCVVLHDAVLLASWAAGERVTAEDAAPPWIIDVQSTATFLQMVGLLDKQGRIPEKSWRSWFGPANERRNSHRERWRRANERRRDSMDTAALPRGNRADSAANPSVPSVPTVPTETPFVLLSESEKKERRKRYADLVEAKVMEKLS